MGPQDDALAVGRIDVRINQRRTPAAHVEYIRLYFARIQPIRAQLESLQVAVAMSRVEAGKKADLLNAIVRSQVDVHVYLARHAVCSWVKGGSRIAVEHTC